ncbi:Transposon Tf2-12 polyprotein [Sesamum angolense]|uniref:Transposon Tf2-12 polyprotein n=1 Tax=Sesamum angolense TaxID=2727404 RepID=A0AAE1VXV5_9LAMI|nr:Transposon Tf2-12 polyprotein [Sesamum angolense]
MFKDKVMQLARQCKISLEEDSATTNAIIIESGHVNGNKDSCNAMHGDNITSNEDTLFEKKDSFDVDDCMSTINFIDEDLFLWSKPHNRTLFVAGYVHEQKVNRILIDGGSAVNILPLRILKELEIPIDELSNSRLMIQDAKTSYNMLLGRPWLHENAVVPSTWHQCFKYCRNGIVKKINMKQPSKSSLKGFVPLTQEKEGGHVALVIDEKGFDPKAFKLLIKAGYDPKEKLNLERLPPEATVKKLHGLNATQIMLKEKGHVIQDSRVVQYDDEDDKESVAPYNYISNSAEENITQTYHITLIEDGEVEDEDAEDAPAEHEEGIKATIDELKEVNLGDIEIPRPIYISEVNKLIEVGFIREFKDLNNACPKDDFLLPSAELMIDATTGHEALSLMDGSSGYNQIRMAPADEELTAFRTPKGIYCYKIMPFRLKNAGTTYQRAMQKIFDDMLHKNVECYVDDLVVKLKKRENHFHDLRKVFECLRRYQLKMNPSKCAFGVISRKFLGFIVCQRGIGIEQAKIDDILRMPEPRNIHELKSLQGKLAYLQRTMTPNELKYSPIEKLCLTLIFSIQKLKHYFQSHSIHLVSKVNPLKYVMVNTVLSDRLARCWSSMSAELELSDDLPDKDVLVIEVTPHWKMYFDGVEHPIKKELALELYLLHQKEKYYLTPLH